jgi:hypothetical protein
MSKKTQSRKTVSQQVINRKLAEWLEIYDKELCADHRQEVVGKEFQLFRELMAMAPADRELGQAFEHYRSHRIKGNLPYTGCAGAVFELAMDRELLPEIGGNGMIFGSQTKHKLPQTREEHDAAKSKGLAAIIKTDIEADRDIATGNTFHGDPLLVLIYNGGFTRAKFPSGRVMMAQFPNVETAIEVSSEAAMLPPWSRATPPRIEVHRVPASGPTSDWLHSIGIVGRYEKPDGTLTDWQ